jgi:thioredoxin reductase (NADPH)
MEKTENLIIIGSGPAGLTAAIYASRGQLEPMVIAGPEPGGQLTWTTEVEDYPGFENPIQGPELVEIMRKQAERFGARVVSEEVVSVDFSTKPFVIKTRESEYKTKSVIIATGASARWLGIESEKKFIGKGVSSCATCDGFFFKGKDVVIVGGGDAAFKEAMYLSKICKSVTILHRRNEFRTQKILEERARNIENIIFKTPYTVEEVQGEMTVSNLIIKNIETGAVEDLATSAMFVAIGHNPNTKFLNGIDTDEAGYIVSDDGVHTNVPGVFVAGDVEDKRYRQAVTAAGAGCSAAMEAEEYLASAS